jgi:ammonia channel protein AmtB
VGAVPVHGAAGFWSALAVGIFAAGYPTGANNVPSSLGGQLLGMAVFLPLGFIPGYVVSWLFKRAKLLRIPEEIELAGQDTHAYGDQYPYFPAAPEPAWTPIAGGANPERAAESR